jgi:hypothetical protein
MKRKYIAAIVIILIALPFLLLERAPENEMPTQDPMQLPDAKSDDLEADLNLMWEVGDTEEDRDWVTATPDAVWAANRVFNSIDVVGLKVNELEAKVKLHLRSKAYGYRAPFWPVDDGIYYLRFDAGAWGWQFEFPLNEQQRITKMNKRWIH